MALRTFLMPKLVRRNSEANEPGRIHLGEEEPRTVTKTNPMSLAHNATSYT